MFSFFKRLWQYISTPITQHPTTTSWPPFKPLAIFSGPAAKAAGPVILKAMHAARIRMNFYHDFVKTFGRVHKTQEGEFRCTQGHWSFQTAMHLYRILNNEMNPDFWLNYEHSTFKQLWNDIA